MIKQLLWTVIGVWLGLCGAAQASDCFDLSNEPAELTACTRKALGEANTLFVKNYHDLVDKARPTGRKKLREAWMAWLSFRDAQCEVDALGSVGTPLHDAVLADCLEQLTMEQSDRLQTQLTCEEGDQTCGGQ